MEVQAKRGGVDPDIVIGRVAENLGGVLEKTINVSWVLLVCLQVCGHCEVEMCYGDCLKFDYELHEVIPQSGLIENVFLAESDKRRVRLTR